MGFMSTTETKKRQPPARYVVRKWADPGDYKGGWAWASEAPRSGDSDT